MYVYMVNVNPKANGNMKIICIL
ncbi:hypothetical protein CH1034_90024 [Klebsiella pneumoniae]|nr:hypothetical protein CH1034_90024 [Klebsiella pneumoniae]